MPPPHASRTAPMDDDDAADDDDVKRAGLYNVSNTCYLNAVLQVRTNAHE